MPINVLMTANEGGKLIQTIQSCSNTAIIIEYGSGGSTVALGKALRSQQQLFSIEHTQEWYRSISTEISKLHIPNVSVLHCPVGGSAGAAYSYGLQAEEFPIGCEQYLHPSINWNRVEMVFIDGVARGACLAITRIRCRPGTYAAIHDYVGREKWYNWAIDPYYTRISTTDSLLLLQIPTTK